MENNELERVKREVTNDVDNMEDIIYLLTLDNIINLYESAKNEKKEYEFIKSLDKYLNYIKDNYSLRKIEYIVLTDITLNNKSLSSIIGNESEYKKLFLFNFYDNVMYYSKFVEDDADLYKLGLEFSEYDFDKDIDKIENVVKSIINNRNTLISNAFISHNDIKKEDDYFIVLLDNLASKYYE